MSLHAHCCFFRRLVQGMTAARATVTTTMSGAAGGVAGLFLKYYLPSGLGGTHVYDVGHTCNSLLGGLVGITAGANVVEPFHAIIIGVLSAIVYHMASCAMRKLKIDDPLDAFAVHGACGLWGVLAVGLFAVKSYTPSKPGNDPDAGLFMPGTRGELFGTQVVALLIEIPWVVGTSFILFMTLKKLGIFRVNIEHESTGLDASKHGGSAYVGETPATKSGVSV